MLLNFVFFDLCKKTSFMCQKALLTGQGVSKCCACEIKYEYLTHENLGLLNEYLLSDYKIGNYKFGGICYSFSELNK